MNEHTAECQNCGAIWFEDDLNEIKDLHQRVEPGEIMPSGECPNCGAVCHRRAPDVVCWPLTYTSAKTYADSEVITLQRGCQDEEVCIYVGIGTQKLSLAVVPDLDKAHKWLAAHNAVDPRHFAICGRHPGDDDDQLLYIEAWPWQDEDTLFAQEICGANEVSLPINWMEVDREGKYDSWVHITGKMEFTGPPVDEP